MTERLYYHDPDLLSFEAEITSVIEEQGRFRTTLSRSAFYPTSGGQSHDLGSINDVAVLNVSEDESGEVYHVTPTSVGRPGEKAIGLIDVTRRWKNRQQHTAQHILSQSFIRLYGFETVSVHLGEEYGAVELEAGNVTPEQLDRAEIEANHTVAADLPVEILFVSVEEAATLPLRKIPAREGTIRIIKVGEYDYSACGGTHCRRTSQVGMIKIIGTEKIRGRTLVKFLAGGQALEDYRIRFAVTDTLSKTLTCHPTDLPGRYDKLTQENKSLRKDLNTLQQQLLPLWSEELAAKQSAFSDLIAEHYDTLDAALAGQLAQQAAQKGGRVVLIFASERVIIAVPPDRKLHAGNLAKQLAQVAGLKGGGSDKVAQLGGGTSGELTRYAELLQKILSDA